jgi:anion-transporting  ArsA/GET3 family ATPase
MGDKLVRMKGIPAPKETQQVVLQEPAKALDVLAKGAYDKTKRTTIVSDSNTFAKVVEGELEKDLEKALKKLEELALGETEDEKKKREDKSDSQE